MADQTQKADSKEPTRVPAAQATAPAPTAAQKLSTLYATDPKKEEEGTWMTVAEGVELKVRSQQSETARAVSKELLKRYRAALSVGAPMTPEQNKEFEIGFCAQALVTDWRGMDGACSDTNVTALVTELPHLRRQILAYSESLENYRPDKPTK
jgi:hypothetical protein